MIRRRPVQRLTSVIVGAIVTALGALTVAVLSGVSIDIELVWIIGLATIGGWLLLTAVLAGRRPRAAADTPGFTDESEEPYDLTQAGTRTDAVVEDPSPR